MKEQPIVSVIVATYHRDEPLYTALESIAQQTYPNLDVVVVDDNADAAWNQTVAANIDRFRAQYPAISLRFICNETNQGSAETRNVGIRAAQGEYVAFLDDDDRYLPPRIEQQLADMLASGADYGLTDLELFNQYEKPIGKRIRGYIEDTDPKNLLRYHLMYHMTGTDTLMFRTDYLKRIGLFPQIDVGDEFYLMERAILEGGKLCYSPHCHVRAYVHEGEEEGLSSGDGKIEGENALYEEKKKYFGELSGRDVRFIKVRHHLVLAFARLRQKKRLSCLKHVLRAMLISPAAAVKVYKKTK